MNGQYGHNFYGQMQQPQQYYPPVQGYYPYSYLYQIPPKKSGGGAAVITCLLGSLVIFVAALVLFGISGGFNDPDSGRSGQTTNEFIKDTVIPASPSAGPDKNGPQISADDIPEDRSEETTIASRVYEDTAASIVCITSYEEGMDYTLDAISQGSGIIITENGYIITNSHVVDDSKKTGVMITLADNRQFIGTIIGVDKKTDIAVIKIDAKDLKPAKFADSDSVKVGQLAFALGNPGGSEFANSLTKGSVSATGRILSGGYVRYIQTDAAINPGNSGGALLNEHSQVIGMNTAKIAAMEYEGMGFAIPSNTVIDVVNKIIKYGRVNDRPRIGIDGKSCTLYMSKANNIPQGVIISSIDSDSPLKSTDAKINDIITAVNDKEIKSMDELTEEMSKYDPGDEITLTMYRKGKNGAEGKSFKISIVLKSDDD